MTINAVMAYTKGLLDGMALPGQTARLVAYVTPPAVVDDPAGPPTVYVWASDGEEQRQSIPRGTPPAAGWKQAEHRLSLWVNWFDQLDAGDADTAFPAVVDAVLARLRSSDDPAALVDPYTGAESQLIDLGERMSWTYSPPQALAPQRIVRYDAEIRAEVLEVFQA